MKSECTTTYAQKRTETMNVNKEPASIILVSFTQGQNCQGTSNFDSAAAAPAATGRHLAPAPKDYGYDILVPRSELCRGLCWYLHTWPSTMRHPQPSRSPLTSILHVISFQI